LNLFLRYCLFACLLDNNKKISCEAEFDAQVVALKVQHAQELASLLHLGSGASDNDGRGSNAVNDEHDEECVTKKTDEILTSTSRCTAPPETTTNQSNNNNNKKQDKARRKRQEQRAAELERQRQIEQEIAQAGPLPRQVELEQLQQILVTASSTSSHQQQQHFEIVEIPADGHCLYRAVAAQWNRIQPNNNSNNQDSSNLENSNYNYQTIRARCADQLQQHPDEYMHFAELHNDDNNNHETATTTVAAFTEYCERVRSGSDWGGHLELRALATALQRPIHIYSVAAQGCVIVEPEEQANTTTTTITSSADAAMLQPIRLSYHVHYYALGEHYNEVVVVVDPS
jgi:OTU domain-containing protein 6